MLHLKEPMFLQLQYKDGLIPYPRNNSITVHQMRKIKDDRHSTGANSVGKQLL